MKTIKIRTFVLLLFAAILAAVQIYVALPNKTTATLLASDPHISVSDMVSFSDISVSDITFVTMSDISFSDVPPVQEVFTDLNQYAIITVKTAVMRESSSTDSKRIKYIPKNEKIIILDSKGNWYKAKHDDDTGWVHADCLELIRNRELEATMYDPIPEQISGMIQGLDGTATAMHIDTISSAQKADGVAVAVIKNGQVAYHYEYGYSDLGHTHKLNQNTKFRAASLSKVFTAMLAMKLVEEGVLDLDEDIGKVYGRTIRNPKYKNTAITTRMLLSHTSSFKDKTPIFQGSFYNNLEDENSYSTSRPGTSFRYSNFGYGIAGAVIERCSGMVLSKYANLAFFKDMGIDASYDGQYLDDKSNVADCINGSKMDFSAAEVVKSKTEYDAGYNFTLGAGGLIINAVDMAKLTCVLTNYGVCDGKRYLESETVSQMFEKQYDTNGFDQCIALRRSTAFINNREVYYHTGSAYGVFTLIVFDPIDASGVVVFSTGATDSKDSNGARKVCSEIASLVYSDIFDI